MMKVAILTVSDRSAKGERADLSGPALAEAVRNLGATVTAQDVVPDDRKIIEERLRALASNGQADIVLTTGGTGVSPRDVTPEATLAVVERRVPGLVEAMRMKSLEVTAHAMLSRAEAGLAGECLIINLPGSPKGAVECFDVIAPALSHAVDLIHGRRGTDH